MPNTYEPDYLGYGSLIKTSGSVANPAVATQFDIPFARVIPYNLQGNAYPSVSNNSAYPSVRYQGKKRPGFTIVAAAKASWLTADFVNGMLFNLSQQGTVQQTDKWSLQLNNVVGTRTWDWARCTDMRLTFTSSGGPVMVQMGFLSRWGETECPYGTTLPDGEVIAAAQTFASPAGSRTGEMADIIDYDWRSDSGVSTSNTSAVFTATQVRGGTLSLLRGQGYVDYCEGTRFAKDIASGAFTGVLSLEQSPTADVIPSTAATWRMYASNAGTPRFKFTMGLSLDSVEQAQDQGLGHMVSHYTLYKSDGTNPCAAATY